MFEYLKYYTSPLIQVLAIFGLYLGGDYVWTGIASFLVLTVLDSLLPDDMATRKMKSLAWTYVLVWISTLLGPFMYVVLAWSISTHALSTWQMVGAVFSCAWLSAVPMVPASHELCHARGKLGKIVGRYAQICFLDSTRKEPHVVGHHIDVGTVEDTDTAARGQTLYTFAPSALVRLSAWRCKWAPSPVRQPSSAAVWLKSRIRCRNWNWTASAMRRWSNRRPPPPAGCMSNRRRWTRLPGCLRCRLKLRRAAAGPPPNRTRCIVEYPPFKRWLDGFFAIKILQGDISMNHINRRLAIAASLALASTAALAQSTPWWVHVGPAAVNLHVSTSPEAPRGTPIPGGGLSATNSNILAFELGYEVAPDWNARLTAGIPPTTELSGIGTLAPLGKAGEIKYGPAVMSVTRALGHYGPVTPYAGAGVSYLKIFSTVDSALAHFAVGDSWGKVLQLGTDVALGPQFGLFLDVKKIYQSADVTGTVPAFGGAPAYARVKIDPLVVQLGVSYRF